MNYQLITRHRVRDLIALAAALAAPPAAAAALLPWRGNWSNTNVALLLMVVVVAVATIGSRRAGALAALGAAAWFDFFFTVPYDRFTIRSQADITTFVLLLVVGLAVSQLAARARRLKAVTITAAAYLAQLHQTALLAQSAPAPQVVVDHVRDQLIDVLGLAGCRFEYGTLLGRPARLEPDGTVLAGGIPRDVDAAGLPAGDLELRVFGSGQYYGRFMLTPAPGSRPTLQARLVAVSLAGQAGHALASSAAPVTAG
ncbi:MAG TPA: DUF4118 domain-containing protein [Streptosporangiaceae bacterium]|jgi:hypothetical protein